jgi:hypothetical protein
MLDCCEHLLTLKICITIENQMKIKNIVLLSMLVIVLTGITASRAGVDVRVSANFIELNDYGEWVIVPGYGTVWRPFAGPDWRPFMYGHWVYTSDGWMWDSDEPFGWVVCHYGNWYYDDDQGWVWLPGYDWSPARVRWYVTDDEIGWAPMFPEPRHGFPHGAMYMQWTFSPTRFFTAVEVRSHLAVRPRPEHGAVRVQVYDTPPRREVIQRIVGAPIVSISLNKVRVTTREHPLVRVEAQNRERSNIEVPVGPKYKKVMVKNQPEPGRPVTITQEKAAQPSVHQEQTDNPRMKAEPGPNVSEEKARDRPRDSHNNQRDDHGDNNREKKK